MAQTREIEPSGRIQDLVKRLTPVRYRDNDIEGDQAEYVTTLPRFLFHFLPALPFTVLCDALENNLFFVALEALILVASYGAGPRGAVAFMSAITLLLLIAKDAYLPLSSRTPGEAFYHAAYALLCVGACEAVLFYAAPSYFYPGFYFGAEANVLVLSMVRLFDNARLHPEDRRTFKEKYHSTKQLWILWYSGMFALMLLSAAADPDDTLRDGLLGSWVAIGFIGSFALRMFGMSKYVDPYTRTIGERGDDVKRAALWPGNRLPRACFWGSVALEIVMFIAAWWIPFECAWRWWTNAPEAGRTDWLTMSANIGGLAAVTISWFFLKYLNRETAGTP